MTNTGKYTIQKKRRDRLKVCNHKKHMHGFLQAVTYLYIYIYIYILIEREGGGDREREREREDVSLYLIDLKSQSNKFY